MPKTTEEIHEWSIEEGAYHYIARKKERWWSEEELREIVIHLMKKADMNEYAMRKKLEELGLS